MSRMLDGELGLSPRLWEGYFVAGEEGCLATLDPPSLSTAPVHDARSSMWCYRA